MSILTTGTASEEQSGITGVYIFFCPHHVSHAHHALGDFDKTFNKLMPVSFSHLKAICQQVTHRLKTRLKSDIIKDNRIILNMSDLMRMPRRKDSLITVGILGQEMTEITRAHNNSIETLMILFQFKNVIVVIIVTLSHLRGQALLRSVQIKTKIRS